MTEAEIRDRYQQELPIYTAYGKYLTDLLTREIEENVDTRDFGELFKVPPDYRVKDSDKLVSKALYRGKSYDHPYEDITDKVGNRFVFLLQSQLQEAVETIEEIDSLEIEKSRDYEEERRKNPLSFEYQSVHFIVRPESEINTDGVTIPEGIPCEVQLRTLLQHAYSELTHDTVYKPRLVATPEVRRVVAKSMALIETTGDMFRTVEEKIQDMDEQFDHINNRLRGVYEEFGTPNYEERLNDFLLGELRPLLEDIDFDINDVVEYYHSDDSNSIIEFIQDHSGNYLIYRQPVILLVFYLVKEHKYRFYKYWPLPYDMLEPIYSRLGYSLKTARGEAVY